MTQKILFALALILSSATPAAPAWAQDARPRMTLEAERPAIERAALAYDQRTGRLTIEEVTLDPTTGVAHVRVSRYQCRIGRDYRDLTLRFEGAWTVQAEAVFVPDA